MPATVAQIASVTPPTAIDYFYDEAKSKLDAQIAQIDGLDSKLGITLGFLGIVGSIVFALKGGDFPIVVRAVTGVLTLGPIGVAAVAFLVVRGGYLDAPDPATLDVLRQANLREDVVKTLLLPNLITAFDHNRPVLALKSRLLNVANIGLGLAVGLLLVLRLFDIIRPS